MVLRPLEFADCLADSPWFRANLHEHECSLQRSYKTIKLLENQCRELVSAAHKKGLGQRVDSVFGFLTRRFLSVCDIENDDDVSQASSC
ncbi:unnamed protein product [Soboliphyme baturini]|uniref:BAR domain-containing protein n=1 Tax=Soboliphyme baturini TaxID=241478 RepID=A0A183J4U6_9BILA|nr:unnamed protein product [Soboliphyme baturini]